MLRIRLAAFAAFIVFSGNADAQAVYRCVEKGKPVSFQSQPCAANSAVSKVIPYQHDEPLTNAQQWDLYYRRQRENRDSAYLRQLANRHTGASGSGAAIGSQPASGCTSMRAQRDAWERSAGLNRNYDTVRYWNDAVARACN